MKRFVLALSFIAILTSSCTIRQTYTFNEDQSGTYAMSIDMTDLAQLSDNKEDYQQGFEDGIKESLEERNMDSLIDAMNAVEGISNAKFFDKEAVMSIQYDFANMEVLRKESANISEFLNDDSSEKTEREKEFKVKGKKWIYTVAQSNDKSIEKLRRMEAMGSLIKADVVMNFPWRIRKVKNPDAVISEDRKSVSVSTDWEGIFAKKSPMNMKIYFE